MEPAIVPAVSKSKWLRKAARVKQLNESRMSKLPPVPPANRSPKGPGSDPEPNTGLHPKGSNNPDNNPDQQGQSANTKQNTTHQGYQQDR